MFLHFLDMTATIFLAESEAAHYLKFQYFFSKQINMAATNLVVPIAMWYLRCLLLRTNIAS